MKKIKIFIILLLVLSGLGFLFLEQEDCCAFPPERIIVPLENSLKFQESITKPEWFDNVHTISINNEKEMSTLWQSEKRCCESKSKLYRNNQKFFKSCYNAILENYNDEKLVVKCLWLMGFHEAREQDIQAKQFIVSNFPNHKSNIKNCFNCDTGDVVARATNSLANYKLRDSLEISIAMMENILKRRHSDISHWIQIDMYVDLSRLYLKQSSISDYQKGFIKKGYDFLYAENKDNERRKSSLKTLNNYQNMIFDK